jgi:phospholipase/lecithinase/hemolysin
LDDDLVIMSAGTADLIALYRATGNSAATNNAAIQAGRDYADQIKRVVGAGAKRVLVMGAYNLGLTPWGQGTPDIAFLTAISKAYDERLLVDIVGMGNNVLYLDGQTYFNGMFNSPGSFGLSNSITPACTSVDAGPGIGIGSGLVSSSLCNTSTLVQVTSTVEVTATVSPFTTMTSTIVSPVNYNLLVFADGVYLTPGAQFVFGNYAYSRLANRW